MAKHLIIGIALGLLTLLAIMSVISSSGDGGDVIARILFILWCTWGPFLSLALLTFLPNISTKLLFVITGTFVGSFGFSFYLLAHTTRWVLTSGPLQEAALVFMVMPTWQMAGLLFGGIAGFLAYLIYRRVCHA